jgi:signal transduction histidine kinase
MKLVPKLTIALVLVTCAVLAVNGYFRVRREVAFFEADRSREHEMIGRSLGAAVGAIWKSQGEQAALQTIDSVDSHFTKIHIHWLAGSESGQLEPVALAQSPAGEPITKVVRGSDVRWYTYVPIDVDGQRRGAIELSEAATNEQQFASRTITDTITMALALVVLSAILSFAMGRKLAEKARRTGRGDFGGPLALTRDDELADLGREINGMCDRLSTTLEQLRHADRLATVGKLASGIAHELGTPLNVVSARAKMIVDGETTSEETQNYAGVIVGAVERMTKIIRQLLQFARRRGPEKNDCDVYELAKESLALLQPLAKKHDVSLALDEASRGTTLRVDAGQLQQVITNLVMNAIQAMPRGGSVRINCRKELTTPPADLGGSERKYLCMSVDDDGEGIAADALPHVFEPFFTTKDIGEGTGLGLAVSYGIVRDHGGWIGVESECGSGSSFRVYLPDEESSRVGTLSADN